MKNNSSDSKKRHISARAKLVPAVAMLSTSAIMLSTSTYAWFTMNKDAQITGLQMTATASESIEISLGQIEDTKTSDMYDITEGSETLPDMKKNNSWNNAFSIGSYYDSIGLLKPASSVNAKDFFDATDASSQGTKAETFQAIDVNDIAAAIKRTAFDDDGTVGIAAINGQNNPDGFYLDIPFHVRTSIPAEQDQNNVDVDSSLYASVRITSVDNDGNTANTDLFKAVRVSVLKSNTDEANVIFGADKDYYNQNGDSNIQAKAVEKASDAQNNTKNSVLGNVNVISDGSAQDTGCKIPANKNSDGYRTGSYVIRVWLEGESAWCFDANSGQSWNIDLRFGLNDTDAAFPNNGPQTP